MTVTRILLGGFEPYSRFGENPSWNLAQALAERCRQSLADPMEAREVLLPVDFREAPPVLHRVLEEFEPGIALLFGLKASTPFLDVEQVALNIGEHHYRAAGPGSPFPLAEGAPAAQESTLNLPPLVANLLAAGIPARLSFHAGTYLCNAVYYHALAWARDRSPVPQVAFIHMPLLPHQAAAHFRAADEAHPSLPLDDTVRGLAHAVERLPASAHSE